MGKRKAPNPAPMDLGHPQVTEEAERYLPFQRAYQKALGRIGELTDLVKTGTLSQEQMVDLDWLVRRQSEAHDHLRKELNKLDELLKRTVGMAWVLSSDSGPIRGQLATGTPDIGTLKILPSRSKDPTGYADALVGLGIPEDLADQQVVMFSWDDTMAYLDRTYTALGKKIPAFFGNGEQSTSYKLKLLTKNDSPLDQAPTPEEASDK